MKTLLVYVTLFMLLIQASIAQETAESRVKKYIWNTTDKDFDLKKSADKWKNASAVILCRKYEYEVRKEILSSYIYENIYSHSRILLQDKAAVDEFSTFSFDISKKTGYYFGWGSNHSVFLGLKVVKPNGKEQEVSIDKKLIDEVKSGSSRTQIQKVAIPNLEVGDILDYYVSFESAISASYQYYGFSPVLYPLVDDYPIQKQKIEMHIMRKCYLAARSMNGAPELKKEDNGKDKDIIWKIEDSDRDKATHQIMVYPLRELPVLAFQAYFVRNLMYNNKYFFVDEEDKVKKSVSDSELSEFFKSTFNNESYTESKKVKKYLNKKYKKEKDPLLLAREAYNYVRENNYAKYYEYNVSYNYDENYYMSDYAFVNILSTVFRNKNIDHSILITLPREIGGIEDLIMREQMGFLLKVNTNPPTFLSNFSRFSLYNELDPSYEGNKAKAIEVKKGELQSDIKDITIPTSDYTKNNLTQTMEVTFNTDEAEKLKINEEIKASGLQKSYYQGRYLTVGDKIKEYQADPYITPSKVTSAKALERARQLIDKAKTDREINMTDELKEEYESENIKSSNIEIIRSGMWDANSEFIMKHQFELDKFISKVGENIILEVGKLIGDQVEPEKSDSVRKYNIYQSFARSIEYIINVPVPQGYKVKGLENLKFNITNETGGFVSSGTMEGNKLVVKVKKYYAKNYLPKDKWPQMLQFLNATLEFKEQKVMFVPGN